MYENYTVREFENAMFRNDRTVMTEEIYTEVYSEYIDTAQLFETEEFQKVAYIHNINGRINTIKLSIKLQKEFLLEFGIPYKEGFKIFKKFGYIVFWKDDCNNSKEFLASLDRIEAMEKKYVNEVENCIKLLIDFRAAKGKKEDQPVKIKRESWIRTINFLGKIGYKIDKDKETVEDLSLMIKQQNEDNKRY